MNVFHLKKVREAILLKPWAFDMSYWESCIAGFAVKLAGVKNHEAVNTFEEAMKILKIGLLQAERLFIGSEWPEQFQAQFDEEARSCVSAELAARRIDHFIATEGLE